MGISSVTDVAMTTHLRECVECTPYVSICEFIQKDSPMGCRWHVFYGLTKLTHYIALKIWFWRNLHITILIMTVLKFLQKGIFELLWFILSLNMFPQVQKQISDIQTSIDTVPIQSLPPWSWQGHAFRDRCVLWAMYYEIFVCKLSSRVCSVRMGPQSTIWMGSCYSVSGIYMCKKTLMHGFWWRLIFLGPLPPVCPHREHLWYIYIHIYDYIYIYIWLSLNIP